MSNFTEGSNMQQVWFRLSTKGSYVFNSCISIQPDNDAYLARIQEIANNIDSTATITEWHLLNDGEVPPSSVTRKEALEQLRNLKWEKKNAGIVLNGIHIATDDRGQATVHAAVTNVLLNAEFTVNWKTDAINADGTAVYATLNKDTILLMAGMLTHYTEACFGIESVKQSQLAGLENSSDIEA